MELSTLIAKIFSLIYITSGLAILLGTLKIRDFIDQFEKAPILTFLSGCIAIIFGMILVNYHNIWLLNWTVLITIISWLMLFIGIIFVILPNSIAYLKKFIRATPFWGIPMLILGLIFAYFGFIA